MINNLAMGTPSSMLPGKINKPVNKKVNFKGSLPNPKVVKFLETCGKEGDGPRIFFDRVIRGFFIGPLFAAIVIPGTIHECKKHFSKGEKKEKEKSNSGLLIAVKGVVSAIINIGFAVPFSAFMGGLLDGAALKGHLGKEFVSSIDVKNKIVKYTEMGKGAKKLAGLFGTIITLYPVAKTLNVLYPILLKHLSSKSDKNKDVKSEKNNDATPEKTKKIAFAGNINNDQKTDKISFCGTKTNNMFTSKYDSNNVDNTPKTNKISFGGGDFLTPFEALGKPGAKLGQKLGGKWIANILNKPNIKSVSEKLGKDKGFGAKANMWQHLVNTFVYTGLAATNHALSAGERVFTASYEVVNGVISFVNQKVMIKVSKPILKWLAPILKIDKNKPEYKKAYDGLTQFVDLVGGTIVGLGIIGPFIAIPLSDVIKSHKKAILNKTHHKNADDKKNSAAKAA